MDTPGLSPNFPLGRWNCCGLKLKARECDPRIGRRTNHEPDFDWYHRSVMPFGSTAQFPAQSCESSQSTREILSRLRIPEDPRKPAAERKAQELEQLSRDEEMSWSWPSTSMTIPRPWIWLEGAQGSSAFRRGARLRLRTCPDNGSTGELDHYSIQDRNVREECPPRRLAGSSDRGLRRKCWLNESEHISQVSAPKGLSPFVWHLKTPMLL